MNRKKKIWTAITLFLIGIGSCLFLILSHKNNTVIYPLPGEASDNAKTEENISSFSLPILTYHHIRNYNNPEDKAGTDISVSPENFDSQMKWLNDNNFQTVGLDYFNRPFKLEKKPIIITFDDGYQDNYDEAFQILNKYDFKGVFYIITDKVNFPEYLTWNEILKMKNAGMIFGSHTLSHPPLDAIAKDKREKEISESKQALEDHLGAAINDFCYPYGRHDQSVVDIVKKYNYKTATTTKSGINNEFTDRLKLERLTVRNESDLKKILNPKSL